MTPQELRTERRETFSPEFRAVTRRLQRKEPELSRMTGQAAPEEDLPLTRCPACGKWIPDLDGFGVLAHTGPDGCGYCSHPSRTGRTCDVCGHVDQDRPA